MTTQLLDANVLIALVVTDHVHHAAAEDWFIAHDPRASDRPDRPSAS